MCGRGLFHLISHIPFKNWEKIKIIQVYMTTDKSQVFLYSNSIFLAQPMHYYFKKSIVTIVDSSDTSSTHPRCNLSVDVTDTAEHHK